MEPRLPLAIAAELLADINRLPAGVNVNSDLVPVGNVAFFGTEQGLWKTDGTAAGTLLVSPVRPVNLPMVNVAGTLFFTASDGVQGIELWKSDGTSAGTVMVKDIMPGVNTGNAFGPRGLTNVSGTLFFSANDGAHGYEPWKSDGTAAGTILIKDILPGTSDTTVGGFTNVNGTAYFNAFDPQLGAELWKTDGSEAGTVLVKDIRPGSESSNPRDLINVGGTLFFSADDGSHGYELWKSDGTGGGTILLKDILPGTDSALSSRPALFANIGGTLFFSASEPASGQELWKSDGTTAGTVLVKDINPTGSSFPDDLTDVSGVLFFRANSNLWKSDGTSAGTVLVKQIDAGSTFSLQQSLTNVNGTVFFSGNDGTTGFELWKSDGTTAGTVLVKDIFPGTNHGYPRRLTNLNGALLFVASQVLNEGRLWRSDGTAAGTTPVPSGNATLSSDDADDISNPRQWNETIGGFNYFVSDDGLHGYELWRTDGTTAGTVLVSDVSPGIVGSHPRYLTNVNGALFFMAGATSSMSLYKHDPLASTTVELANFREGSSFRENLVNIDGTLFFRADDRIHGAELWKSDGTTAGTVLVKDIVPGQQTGYRYSQYPYDLTNVSGRLFFRASDGLHGAELWTSDATEAGTVLVKDLNPGEEAGVGAFLTNVNGALLFLAADSSGPALARSDGTGAGTMIIKNFAEAVNFANVGGTLFFSAISTDGATGRELWRSDGTTAGTVLVKDIVPGSFGSGPAYLTSVNGTLFFATTSQNESWRSDGTEAGTRLLREFPQQGTGVLRGLVNVDGQLYFSAPEIGLGHELWTSDGTIAGTVLVKDILPGVYSSAPRNARAFQGRLLFSADDGIHGRELWEAFAAQEPPPPPPRAEFDLSQPNRAAIVADPDNPGQLALLVVGGTHNDAIVVEPRPTNRDQIRVKQNGRLLGIFPAEEFERIAAFGMAGHDTILIDPRIGKPAELHGRAGNDSLFGGAGTDLLFGEAGKDRLFGRSGSDQIAGGTGNDSLFGGGGNDMLRGDAGNDLIFGEAGHDFLLGGSGNDQLFGSHGRDALSGGAGRDLLFGQADDDILVGGSTAHDDDLAAQADILAAWTTSASFSSRISGLASLLSGDSVFADNSRDQLSGGSGSDWFWNSGLNDLLSDFATASDRRR